MGSGVMEKGSRGRRQRGQRGGSPHVTVAGWQQEERGSTGTGRALSAPLSHRGMGEALEGGCGLASSAGLAAPGVPPALTPPAGFAELSVFISSPAAVRGQRC